MRMVVHMDQILDDDRLPQGMQSWLPIAIRPRDPAHLASGVALP